MTENWTLISKTIELSVNKNWNEAKKEWKVYHIYLSPVYLTCSCGHYPITEIVRIENIYNNNEMIVGNCCIKKFIDEDYDKFFHSLYRNTINAEIIMQGFKDGVINEWEKDFLMDIWRKRKFSSKQANLNTTLRNKLIIFYKQKLTYKEAKEAYVKAKEVKERLKKD